MFGQLSANDTLRMSTEYVNNVVPALVSPGIIKKLGNSTLVEWLLNEVGNFITKEAVKSFKDSNEAGVFPQWVYDEMAGIAAGANSKLRANQQVDPDRECLIPRERSQAYTAESRTRRFAHTQGSSH